MANSEHIEMLKKGVRAWNRWRKDNPEIVPDLSNTVISEESLRKRSAENSNYDLRSSGSRQITMKLKGKLFYKVSSFGYFSDLRPLDLRWINLNRAVLNRSVLTGVDLMQADLRNSRLDGANFSQAILVDTGFEGAAITSVDFTAATLNRANFSQAYLRECNFINVDISEIRGLDAIKYLGPSAIDIETVYKSQGRIPEVFFRGCGVPEDFIQISRSVAKNAVNLYSCFVSYSSQDEGIAQRLYSDLQAKGVRCWFAPEDIKIGDKIRFTIDESIRKYDKLLIILSQSSVKSSWVEHEVEAALEKERIQGTTTLYPIRIDDAVLQCDAGWAAKIKRERHIGDFRNWKKHDLYMKSFGKLLRDLQQHD